MVIIGYNGLIKSVLLIDDDWEWFDSISCEEILDFTVT